SHSTHLTVRCPGSFYLERSHSVWVKTRVQIQLELDFSVGPKVVNKFVVKRYIVIGPKAQTQSPKSSPKSNCQEPRTGPRPGPRPVPEPTGRRVCARVAENNTNT
ncbi:Unknown protein, partial [Striga hermonthica]